MNNEELREAPSATATSWLETTKVMVIPYQRTNHDSGRVRLGSLWNALTDKHATDAHLAIYVSSLDRRLLKRSCKNGCSRHAKGQTDDNVEVTFPIVLAEVDMAERLKPGATLETYEMLRDAMLRQADLGNLKRPNATHPSRSLCLRMIFRLPPNVTDRDEVEAKTRRLIDDVAKALIAEGFGAEDYWADPVTKDWTRFWRCTRVCVDEAWDTHDLPNDLHHDAPIDWAGIEPLFDEPVRRAKTAAASSAGARSDVTERARRYLETMGPAVSGEGGHSHTLKAATALMRGFSLDEEKAFDLLSEWNRSCDPQWSEKELRHKIASAQDSDMQYGCLLAGSDVQAGGDGQGRPVSGGEKAVRAWRDFLSRHGAHLGHAMVDTAIRRRIQGDLHDLGRGSGRLVLGAAKGHDIREDPIVAPTPWPTINDAIGGLKAGEVCAVIGGTAGGKTTTLHSIAGHYAAQDFGTALFDFESYGSAVCAGTFLPFLGRDPKIRNLGALVRVAQHNPAYGAHLVYPDIQKDRTYDERDIMDAVEAWEHETGRKIHIIVIDYLDKMENRDLSKEYRDPYKAQEMMLRRLMGWAERGGKVIFTGLRFNRAGGGSAKDRGRGRGTGVDRSALYKVGGSVTRVELASLVVTPNPRNSAIDVLKVRDSWELNEGISIPYRFVPVRLEGWNRGFIDFSSSTDDARFMGVRQAVEQAASKDGPLHEKIVINGSRARCFANHPMLMESDLKKLIATDYPEIQFDEAVRHLKQAGVILESGKMTVKDKSRNWVALPITSPPTDLEADADDSSSLSGDLPSA